MISKKIQYYGTYIGVLLFTLLYFVSGELYPGGSQDDHNSKGFSWIHNYWCNLLNENAINGVLNPARPMAMLAMIILGVSLVNFWYVFPKCLPTSTKNKNIITFSGVLSMIAGLLLFTSIDHDLTTNIGSAFGFIALTATIYALYSIKRMDLFWLGICIPNFCNQMYFKYN